MGVYRNPIQCCNSPESGGSRQRIGNAYTNTGSCNSPESGGVAS